MNERIVYFLFTDTGTYLSRMINYFTKQSLNHVSIGFDDELTEVYSFGRKRPWNPFSGGFVREDVRGNFLRDSRCAIYMFRLSEEECERVLGHIKNIESEKDNYRYNFLGLIGILFNIEINRNNAFFCSQFVATVLKDSESFHIAKPHCFVTPTDIREHMGMQLIYQGILGDYAKGELQTERKIMDEKSALAKQSFIFILRKKVKQFVIR